MSYQHLLVAVDTGDDRARLIRKAQQLAQAFGAELSVVSVMRPVPVDTMATDVGMGMPVMANLGVEAQFTAELRDELHKSLCTACAPFGIGAERIHLITDNVDSGVLDTAAKISADLLVLGHREHSGFFAKLFSHTDQSIVGKASCDVLTVALEPAAGN